jgi:hypothetical protein
MSYLMNQIDLFPTAKFIFVTREQVNMVRESEFITKFSTSLFKLSEISFSEITHFLEKNFSMPEREAEVIALRLRNTFNRFDLSAHPTYFVGIPRETLSALLHANRRSELIQLAVDGFLTFVVASDKADVALSRTTRSHFLRKLAVSLKVEKQSFTQTELIEFTKRFSTEFDFEIDPLEFIHSFVEKGILYFENEIVRFSLPFIEAYLLALELTSDVETATKYFDLRDPDFDLHTFDLYAELGASNELVQAVMLALTEKLAFLDGGKSNRHVLLSGEIAPSMLAKPERLHLFQERLRSAVQDVQGGRDDKARKQRLLDIADRVREKAAKRSEEGETPSSGAANAEPEVGWIAATRVWAIGTVLLGSGAERLNATTKRKLINTLIKLAALIIDEWTKIHRSVDFSAIKKELTSDTVISNVLEQGEPDVDRDEITRLISSVADVLEFYFLAEPFRRIVHHLCEQGRHRVLGISVENADVTGQMESIIHGAWLTDIDSKRGRSILGTAIRGLPPAPFLRVTLASHFLTRVYWSHWDSGDRLVLLEAADEAIKPVAIRLNKGRLQRLIDKTPPTDNPR